MHKKPCHLNAGFWQPAEAPMHMNDGPLGQDSHASERSRARAARGLAATVQSRMAGANVAGEMERAMGLDAGIRKTWV